jgi:hypothetical protein
MPAQGVSIDGNESSARTASPVSSHRRPRRQEEKVDPSTVSWATIWSVERTLGPVGRVLEGATTEVPLVEPNSSTFLNETEELGTGKRRGYSDIEE